MHLTRLRFNPDPEGQLGKPRRSAGQGCGGPSAARHGRPRRETRDVLCLEKGRAAEGKPTDVGCTEIRETSALNPGGFLLIAKSEGERFRERESPNISF